jgi:hypothetical protein
MARKFPVVGVLLLIVAIVWLLSDLGILTINIPWLPVVLGVVAIGLIYNRIRK